MYVYVDIQMWEKTSIFPAGMCTVDVDVAWCETMTWICPLDSSSMYSYTMHLVGSFLTDQGPGSQGGFAHSFIPPSGSLWGTGTWDDLAPEHTLETGLMLSSIWSSNNSYIINALIEGDNCLQIFFKEIHAFDYIKIYYKLIPFHCYPPRLAFIWLQTSRPQTIYSLCIWLQIWSNAQYFDHKGIKMKWNCQKCQDSPTMLEPTSRRSML